MAQSRRWMISSALLLFALAWGSSLRWQEARKFFEDSTIKTENYFELGSDLAKMDGSYSLRQYPGEEAFRSFLYPSLIGLTFRFWPPPHLGKILLLQIILNIFLCLSIYLIGREIHSSLAGALGALFAALNGALVLTASSVDIQYFFSLLVLLVFWRTIFWLRQDSPRNTLLLGLSMGLCLCCRSTLFAFPFILIAYTALKQKLKHVRPLLLLAFFTALPLSPWIARNALSFGEFIPLERRISIPHLFLGSLGFEKTAEVKHAFSLAEEQDPSLVGQDIESYYAAMKRMALRNVSSNLFRYLRSCFKRILLFIRICFDQASPFIWMLAALGIYALKGSPFTRALSLLTIYFTLIHSIGPLRQSYGVPIIVIVCLVAGTGGAFLFERFFSKKKEPEPRLPLDFLPWLPAIGAYTAGIFFLTADFAQARRPVEDLARTSQSCIKLNGKALNSFQQGRAQEALAIFEYAVSADPACVPAWIGQGALLAGQNKFEPAFAAYDHAEHLLKSGQSPYNDPKEPSAWHACVLINRANLYELMGKKEQALKAYRKSLSVAPQDWMNRRFIDKKIKELGS